MTWTRDDQNRAWRAWYARNRKRKIAWQERRREELRVFIRELKIACASCAESHPGCLQFHHRDPSQKEGSIANATAGNWSRKRIADEVEKCDVLCANCHAKLHHSGRSAVW